MEAGSEWTFHRTKFRYCGTEKAATIAQAQYVKPQGAINPEALYHHFEITEQERAHNISIPCILRPDAKSASIWAEEIAISQNWV